LVAVSVAVLALAVSGSACGGPTSVAVNSIVGGRRPDPLPDVPSDSLIIVFLKPPRGSHSTA
jgi:hypothetical protein